MTVSEAPVDGAPALLEGAVEGRRFRGLVTFARSKDRGPGSVTAEVVDMKLRPLGERNALIRVEVSAPCYTMMQDVFVVEPLKANPPALYRASGLPGAMADAPPTVATRTAIPDRPPGIPGMSGGLHTANHSYVGVVEAIGPSVRRVKVGDRVIVGPTPQCGVCYQCLSGATEMCQIVFGQQGEFTRPFADTDDGTPVVPFLGVGGMSELTVAWEEFLCPVSTDLSSVDLSLLGCQLASGLATGISRMQIFPGADVVVFGAGPVGASAILSAVARSAGQIIAVEPIAYRREIALQLGATAVLDPWEEGDNLVPRIHEMCRPRTDNRFAGGHPYVGFSQGADFAIGAVGNQIYDPAEGVEHSPDPTGILPFQQTYGAARMGGNVVWLGLTTGEVALPPNAIAMLGKTIWPGQQAGIQTLRDIPRFVKLMESGAINYKPLYNEDAVYGLDDAVEAVRVIGERRIMTSVVRMG